MTLQAARCLGSDEWLVLLEGLSGGGSGVAEPGSKRRSPRCAGGSGVAVEGGSNGLRSVSTGEVRAGVQQAR